MEAVVISSWEELVATVRQNEIYRMTRPNQTHCPYWDEVSYVKVWPGNRWITQFSEGEGIGASHELKPGGSHGSLPIMKGFFEEEGFLLERVERPQGMTFSYE